MDNPQQAIIYCEIYESQRGGDCPFYRGAWCIQYGSGFGDVLLGIFRHVLPIVARGAATFFGDMMQNRDQGATWTTAPKSAMAPAAQSMMSQASKQIGLAGSVRKRKALYKHKNLGKRKYPNI